MNTERRHLVGIDTIIMILLSLVSLEINIPYVLDQLDFHKAMQCMGPLKSLICPHGMDNPLVIMQNQFVPLKLMIRSITLAIIILWCMTDISRSRWSWRIRWMLTLTLIAIHVILPTGMLIAARLGSDNHALAHDGGTIQIEEAMKMVLQGRNPYTETFHGTPLENWRGFSNNIIYHVPYMPGAFLFFIPSYLAIQHTAGFYDQRIMHLILFLTCLFLLVKITSAGPRRIIACLAFSLNPFFLRYFALGTNDIVIMTGLLTTVFLIDRRCHTGALTVLAVTCSIKQFAWFFVPFLMAESLGLEPRNPAQWPGIIRRNAVKWAPGIILFLAILLPFVLWDTRSFLDDTLRYGSGGLPTSYPMQGFHGYGFATVPLFFGWVRDGSAAFPFFLLQFVIAGPFSLWLWIRFSESRDLATAVTFASMTLLPFLFLSRYLHGNFIGFIVFWPILGWCMRSSEDTT